MKLASLPGEISQLLAQHGQPRSFSEGETIISQGQPMISVPFVTKGSVRITTEDANGHELLLYYLRPGESCIATLLTSAQTTGTNVPVSTIKAIAEENTDVVVIPQELARDLVVQNPAWNRFMLSLYQKRFEELLQAVNDIAFSRVDERLVDLLGRKVRQNKSAILYLTHQQLADELGTAREVVSRLLKRLEQDGRVELQRGKLKVISAV